MAAKLTRLTHKIAIQLHLVAEGCTICSSRSRRSVRKLLDKPYIRSCPPYLEAVSSIRNPRMRHGVVRGTHITWQRATIRHIATSIRYNWHSEGTPLLKMTRKLGNYSQTA